MADRHGPRLPTAQPQARRLLPQGMNTSKLASLTGLVFLLGCQTPNANVAGRDHDALMAYVPEGDQGEVHAAQQERAAIDESLAVARRDVAEISSHETMSQQNKEAIRARHEEAVLRVRHAQKFDDTEALATARDSRHELAAAVRLQDAKRNYYDDLQKLAKERVEWLERRAALADARLELAKAEAVSELDRPAAKDIDLLRYHEAVHRAGERVDSQRIEVLVAQRRAELRAEFADSCAGAVPDSLRLQPLEPIAKVFAADLKDAGLDQEQTRAAEAAAKKDSKRRE